MRSDVTIIVPTLGRRLDWLELTLRSIRSQSEPCELVLVGPSDAWGARELAKTHKAQWLPEQGSSIGAAINQGFHAAETTYVGWLGDDDLLTPESLSRSVDALENSAGAAMVYGRILCIDDSGNRLFMIAPGRFASQLMRFGHDFLPQPGSLFRRESVVAVGGLDESLQYAMDLDLFLKLRREGPLVYLPKLQAHFRRHSGSLTVSNPHPGVEARMIRERYLSPGIWAVVRAFEPLISVGGKLWAKGFTLDPRKE